MPKCPAETLLTREALIILLPSVAVSLVLGVLVVAWIACRKRDPNAAKKGDNYLSGDNGDNRHSSEIVQQVRRNELEKQTKFRIQFRKRAI